MSILHKLRAFFRGSPFPTEPTVPAEQAIPAEPSASPAPSAKDAPYAHPSEGLLPASRDIVLSQHAAEAIFKLP